MVEPFHANPSISRVGRSAKPQPQVGSRCTAYKQLPLAHPAIVARRSATFEKQVPEVHPRIGVAAVSRNLAVGDALFAPLQRGDTVLDFRRHRYATNIAKRATEAVEQRRMPVSLQ